MNNLLPTTVSWKTDTLTNMAEFHNGAAFNAKDWGEEGLPIIRIEQLNNKDAESDKYCGPLLPINFIDDGDLIFSWSATLKVCVWKRGPGALNQHLYKVIPKPGINKYFLRHLLDFNMENLAAQSQGSTMKHVTRKELSRFHVSFPEQANYQNNIAKILDIIDHTIEKTEALIHKYQQIKAGLMHDLFTRGLTADGKLRPPREQAPELYQETPIGWIPKEWNYVQIRELCSQIVDCPHSTPSYQDSGIPCIRTADMEPGQLLLEQAYRVKERDYLIRTLRLVPKKGDIIYSREGERLGIASPVGEEKVCLGQRVMLLRPQENIDSNFLLWSMNLPGFYRRVVRGLGATTSPHVNVGDIKSILTCRPPGKEQSLIGKALRKAQLKLLKEERYRKKLASKKLGLMHDLLTGEKQVKIDSEELSHG